MFYTQWVLLCPVAGLFKCHPNGRVTQTNKRINSKHLDLIFSVLGIKNKNIKIGQIYIYIYTYTHTYIYIMNIYTHIYIHYIYIINIVY